MRGTADLDALGEDPVQCVADWHLRCRDVALRVATYLQGEDGFGGGGLDS